MELVFLTGNEVLPSAIPSILINYNFFCLRYGINSYIISCPEQNSNISNTWKIFIVLVINNKCHRYVRKNTVDRQR